MNGNLILLAILSTMCTQHVQQFLVLNTSENDSKLLSSPEMSEYWCESDHTMSKAEYDECKLQRQAYFESNNWVYKAFRGIRRTNHYPHIIDQEKTF